MCSRRGRLKGGVRNKKTRIIFVSDVSNVRNKGQNAVCSFEINFSVAENFQKFFVFM